MESSAGCMMSPCYVSIERVKEAASGVFIRLLASSFRPRRLAEMTQPLPVGCRGGLGFGHEYNKIGLVTLCVMLRLLESSCSC